MSFWDKNSAVLKQRYGGLFEQLNLIDDDFNHEIKIETSATGVPTLSINGLFVHSQRDPVREGHRAAQAVEAGYAPVVIFGFGLGYAAQSAASCGRTKGSRPVIIVEKYKKLLRIAFENRDLTDLLSSDNIIFVAGGSGGGIVDALAVLKELNKNSDEEFKPPFIIRNKALFDLDSEWYKNVEDKIRAYSMKDKVNTATQKRFAKRWVRNIVRNGSAIRDVPGINLLTRRRGDAAIEFPVFLAAAGPSLDKIKPYLNDIYDRCVIVAVDTALRFFNKNGIQPDFVLTCDPQFWNSRHLDFCNYEKTALIGESAVYPPVLRLPFKRKFLCGSLFPLGTFIEERVDSKGRLAAGGSVATTAYDFALQFIMHNSQCIMSNDQLAINNKSKITNNDSLFPVPCSLPPIWIAGLDLAYPDYKTHFRGARFEEKANSETCRLKPVETWASRALRDGIPFKAKSAGGGEVLTDRRLSLYAAWFENQFSQHENIRNLALFQEGLAIKGLTNASAEQLLALPVRRKELDAYFEERYAQIETEFNNEEEARKRSGRYEKAVESLIRCLNSIKKTAEEGIKIIEGGRKDAVKDLDRICKKIETNEVKDIVSFIMPIDETAEKESDYYKSSLKLFTSLLESAEWILNLMGSSFNTDFHSLNTD